MKSVDPFLDRVFVEGKYECRHHASEVWEAITGQPFDRQMLDFLEGVTIGRAVRSQYKRIVKPSSPCIALFRNSVVSHVGVYVRGKVLHLTERDGVQYVPVHVITTWYPIVRFYAQQPTRNPGST